MSLGELLKHLRNEINQGQQNLTDVLEDEFRKVKEKYREIAQFNPEHFPAQQQAKKKQELITDAEEQAKNCEDQIGSLRRVLADEPGTGGMVDRLKTWKSLLANLQLTSA